MILGSSEAMATTSINLDDALKQACANSYDVKLAKLDKDLAANDISQNEVAFYPTLRAQTNYEYQRALTNTNNPVVAVGNTVLPTGTRFQESVSVMGNYLLNDFGARKKLLQSSKNHELATAYVVDEQIRNLKVKVIDLYTDVLLEFNSVAAKMKMLELNQRLFSIKQRLFDAGQIPKTDLSDQSLKVAQLLDSIQQNKKSFSEKLKELSYYTHQITVEFRFVDD
jgi:outer membrane protein TolC